MEVVDKFNNKRIPLNKITERHEKTSGEYKQSMHVWIQNDDGDFLIQKRSITKTVFPGEWSVTGGGVNAGESTLDTVIRECNEELGINVEDENVQLMMTIKREYDFVDIYLLRQNIKIEDIVLQEEEVSDVKWISKTDLTEMIENGDFCSSVSFYFDMLIKIIEKFS